MSRPTRSLHSPRICWASPRAWAPAPTKTRSAIRCCWWRWRSPAAWTRARWPTPQIAALIRHLRDAAFADRAGRIAAYVGGVDTRRRTTRSLLRLAQHLLRPDPNDSPVRWAEYRALVERTRFAAVFTAHPTFALPTAVNHALAEAACGRPAPGFASHRPPPITLGEEFEQAAAAIANGRDAIDRFNAALLTRSRAPPGRTAGPS